MMGEKNMMIDQPAQKSKRPWLLIVGAALMFFCVVCIAAFFAIGILGKATSTVPQPVNNAPQPSGGLTLVAASTKTPFPTSPPPLGASRSNPIPAGAAINIGGGATLTITNVVRPANDIVSRGNQFNSKPEAGLEYVQVGMTVSCDKPSDSKCSFSPLYIKAVGADGQVRDAEWTVTGVDGVMDVSTEFFGGSSLNGKLFYLVPKDDPNVVLFYDPLFGDSIYMALQ